MKCVIKKSEEQIDESSANDSMENVLKITEAIEVQFDSTRQEQ